MKLHEIRGLLSGEVLTDKVSLEIDINYCYGCDLMSDVLAYVQNNVLLLTGLVHPQVIRTAEMLDLKAIVFVRGKRPTEEMVSMAEDKGIVLICSKHSLYTSSGILYENGLLGEEITHEATLQG
ncbi:hypothetical protein [Vallitalea okinawensis]|uniref:hypothetical protein n=1 Tax=Vallitalea okinawensis TaxID=2078660 RepID=UPI000CFC6DAC|nr:hypothetical protein [Vallitalea okinawensis]